VNIFVDFERGLNKAINKLRAALRDDAENQVLVRPCPSPDIALLPRLKTWLWSAVTSARKRSLHCGSSRGLP
jgi:hypothetical protein